MRRFLDNLQGKHRLAVILTALLLIAVAIPLLSCAQTQPATTITITNSSNWEIKHVYLSPPDSDNWGPDQLGGSAINPGQTFTLNNAECNGSTVKVISEDQNGCFLYNVVACADNASWTITNDAAPDCGS
jgi:hypothetical protein